ncbi:MAG: vitamin K epoxide reductase family protein [Acidobacteria bacterium]|nr:vitamin K epoxide reductase family protein [Acidobacteriota bacterium]
MSDAEIVNEGNGIAKLPLAAALLALVGLFDSIYLTIHHYTGENVPCSVTGGCEMVLTSAWSQIAGYPLSIFGAAAYFVAFSLALLAAFGNRPLWKLFGLQTLVMAGFSFWLIYLQAFVIGAFCQFCLLSAATSITLCIIALASRFWRS